MQFYIFKKAHFIVCRHDRPHFAASYEPMNGFTVLTGCEQQAAKKGCVESQRWRIKGSSEEGGQGESLTHPFTFRLGPILITLRLWLERSKFCNFFFCHFLILVLNARQ